MTDHQVLVLLLLAKVGQLGALLWLLAHQVTRKPHGPHGPVR